MASEFPVIFQQFPSIWWRAAVLACYCCAKNDHSILVFTINHLFNSHICGLSGLSKAVWLGWFIWIGPVQHVFCPPLWPEGYLSHTALLGPDNPQMCELNKCGRPGFDPWVEKIPWKRERLPTPVFWPGKCHGHYSPWGHKESDTTEQLSLNGQGG